MSLRYDVLPNVLNYLIAVSPPRLVALAGYLETVLPPNIDVDEPVLQGELKGVFHRISSLNPDAPPSAVRGIISDITGIVFDEMRRAEWERR